jgi:hypothetical protein
MAFIAPEKRKNDLPIIGPWSAKLTRIQRLTIVDCVPEGYALIYGIAVGEFHLFWSIFGPDCLDQTWDRVRRPQRKHRTLKLTGTAYPPTIPAPPGRLGNTLILLGNLAQRIGFWLSLVDGVLTGVYYGESLVRRYSGCASPGIAHCQLGMTNKVPELLPASEGIINSWELISQAFMFGDGAGVAFTTTEDHDYTMVVGMQQGMNEFPPLEDCTFTIDVVDLAQGAILKPIASPLNANSGTNKVWYVQDFQLNPGAHRIVVLFKKTFGVMFITKGFFTVTASIKRPNWSPHSCGASKGV